MTAPVASIWVKEGSCHFMSWSPHMAAWQQYRSKYEACYTLSIRLGFPCNRNPLLSCIRLCIPATRSTWYQWYLVQCGMSRGWPESIFWFMLLWEKTIYTS